jgi:hypothetical protein
VLPLVLFSLFLYLSLSFSISLFLYLSLSLSLSFSLSISLSHPHTHSLRSHTRSKLPSSGALPSPFRAFGGLDDPLADLGVRRSPRIARLMGDSPYHTGLSPYAPKHTYSPFTPSFPSHNPLSPQLLRCLFSPKASGPSSLLNAGPANMNPQTPTKPRVGSTLTHGGDLGFGPAATPASPQTPRTPQRFMALVDRMLGAGAVQSLLP